MKDSNSASTGVRVKTGKAIAVLLRGPLKSPVIVKRQEWILVDPKHPDTMQPYHVVMDLPWTDAREAVKETASLVRKIASKEIRSWDKAARALGLELCGVGIVAGSDQDPSKIGNPHIRAHAAEGRLFRDAIEAGTDSTLSKCCFLEKEIYETAAEELELSVANVKARAAEFGVSVGRPWRGDEKVAAISAWLMLARHVHRLRR